MATDDSKATGDQIYAEHSQGFINSASGAVSQNFGEQTTIDTRGGDLIGGDKTIIIQSPPVFQALHQLRAPVGDFVGREREIDELVQAFSKAADGEAAAAISGVRGMGSIGKTEIIYSDWIGEVTQLLDVSQSP